MRQITDSSELITVAGNKFKYAGIFTGCTFLIAGFLSIGPPLWQFILRLFGRAKVSDEERFDEPALTPATIQSDGKTVVESAQDEVMDEKNTVTTIN